MLIVLRFFVAAGSSGASTTALVLRKSDTAFKLTLFGAQVGDLPLHTCRCKRETKKENLNL